MNPNTAITEAVPTTNLKNRELMIISNNIDMSSKLRKLMMAVMVMMLSAISVHEAKAQCANQALVCNNLVRVSLDSTCTALITPDLILKGINIDTSLYDVEVLDLEGNVIPDGLLTEEFAGQRLEVRVICSENELFCWGNLIVEDKIPPTISVLPCDTILSCAVMPFELDPTALITRVSINDNCGVPDTFAITDFNVTDFPCSDTVKIIERVFTTVDGAGNTASKTQTIFLLRAELNEIIFPQDTIIDCLDEADISTQALGLPDFGSCENFELNVRDDEIITCGVARKILRTFTVNDICTNRDTTVTQVIAIEDLSAPKIIFDNFDIPLSLVETDKFNCTSSVIGINNPQITDCNLAQTIVTVFYQRSTEAGNLFGPLFSGVVNDMLSDPFDPTTATMIFDLPDVPVGMPFRVIFVADDQCGNIARDTSAIFTLPDTSPPNAVCEGFTTVVLNTHGTTEVFAQTFDDNSFDNCGIVNQQVRRFNSTCPGSEDDAEFGNSITFCCDDIANSPIKVVFRVYDGAGGFSDCIVDVFVQDKRPISITCPSIGPFACGTDSLTIAEAILANPPMVEYVCGEESLTVDIPSFMEDECGGANFSVTWTARDLNGQMATCVIPIEIRNLVPARVIRPNLMIDLSSCTAGTSPDDIEDSRPTLIDVDCERINISYEDNLMTGSGSNCFTIIRTWTVIDWCLFNNGDVETAIIDNFDQTINIADTNEPVITDCPSMAIVIDDTDESCDEMVTLSISATDDCTPAEDLTYQLVIDLNSDESEDLSFTGSIVSTVVPVGTHRATWSVTDVCGNIATCSYDLVVNSDKAPSPICTGLVGVTIGADGSATLEASALNVKSTNGCSESEEGLTFSFTPDGSQPTMIFTCSDIPNGVLNETTVDLYVIDADGNAASCNVIVTLRDGASNACTDDASVAAALAGRVTDEELSGVEGVEVMAIDQTTGTTYQVTTDENGDYSFPALSIAGDYRVAPVLDGFPLAGVSTLDLVLIQRHIIGLQPLVSPYKKLAADVNNSNSISAVDLVELRRLILGITTDLPEQDWKFADSDYDFAQQNQWLYNDHIMVGSSAGMGSDHDFIGMKVGDVSGNAFAALASLSGGRSVQRLEVSSIPKGDITRYAFSAVSMDEIVGLQLSLDVSGLNVVSVGSEQQIITPENYLIKDGTLRFSWSSATDILSGSGELFYVDVRNSNANETISLARRSTMTSEIIGSDLVSNDIVLEQANQRVQAGLQLLQNTPNPFTDETKISFSIPEAGEVEFVVTNLNGKQIYRSTNLYNKGTNTITLSSDELGQSGIYYYTVIHAASKQTKRMIVLY